MVSKGIQFMLTAGMLYHNYETNLEKEYYKKQYIDLSSRLHELEHLLKERVEIDSRYVEPAVHFDYIQFAYVMAGGLLFAVTIYYFHNDICKSISICSNAFAEASEKISTAASKTISELGVSVLSMGQKPDSVSFKDYAGTVITFKSGLIEGVDTDIMYLINLEGETFKVYDVYKTFQLACKYTDSLKPEIKQTSFDMDLFDSQVKAREAAALLLESIV